MSKQDKQRTPPADRDYQSRKKWIDEHAREVIDHYPPMEDEPEGVISGGPDAIDEAAKDIDDDKEKTNGREN